MKDIYIYMCIYETERELSKNNNGGDTQSNTQNASNPRIINWCPEMEWFQDRMTLLLLYTSPFYSPHGILTFLLYASPRLLVRR